LVLTDDDGIRDVNRRCFFRDAPTDVITLSYTALPGAKARPSAEIFVNVECALHRAKGKEARARRELALYIAHGLDHFLGGRDDTSSQRGAMLRRELGWVRQAERDGLLDFALPPAAVAPPRRSDCAITGSQLGPRRG
jgi:rRNA maturation RNase YbeY